VRARLPERKGDSCRIVLHAKSMNTVLVEFEDGYLVVTSRNYVRKRKPVDNDGGQTRLSI
jgi:hypothetical protein